MPINTSLVVCLSLALLLVVFALAREMRLRRALQLLLARIISLWRSRSDQHRDSPPHRSRPTNLDGDAAADDRPP